MLTLRSWYRLASSFSFASSAALQAPLLTLGLQWFSQ